MLLALCMMTARGCTRPTAFLTQKACSTALVSFGTQTLTTAVATSKQQYDPAQSSRLPLITAGVRDRSVLADDATPYQLLPVQCQQSMSLEEQKGKEAASWEIWTEFSTVPKAGVLQTPYTL